MREPDLMRAIMLATTDDVDWHRNNVGAYDANPICPHCRRRHDPRRGASWIRYGVGGPGGSDLIGIVRGSGVMIAAEIKTPRGRESDDQRIFGERVRRSGAIYVLARSADDITDEIRRYHV